MTAADWQAVLDKMELRHFPWHMRIEVLISPFADELELHGTMHVPDRDTGADRTIHLFEIMSAEQQVRPERIIRQILHRMVEHELDECLTFGGKRTFDPHRGEAGI